MKFKLMWQLWPEIEFLQRAGSKVTTNWGKLITAQYFLSFLATFQASEPHDRQIHEWVLWFLKLFFNRIESHLNFSLHPSNLIGDGPLECTANQRRSTLNLWNSFYRVIITHLRDKILFQCYLNYLSISRSVMPDYLQPHGLYSAFQVPLSMEFCRQEY